MRLRLKKSSQLILTTICLLIFSDIRIIEAQTSANDLSDENWSWANSRPGVTGNSVLATAIVGDLLYAAGNFDAVSGYEASNFAIFDSETDLWFADNKGPDDNILALAHHDGQIYAGGQFTSVNGQAAGKMAVYSIESDSWSPFDISFNGDVTELYVSGGNLYIGGRFDEADDTEASHIIRYDLTNGS